MLVLPGHTPYTPKYFVPGVLLLHPVHMATTSSSKKHFVFSESILVKSS